MTAKLNENDGDWVLYGDRRSGSAAIELALAELDVDVELCDVSLDSNAQQTAAYRAVNPHGKLPALKPPSGELLTESAAILITLDERHPGAGLLPSNPAERARAIRWLLFIATEIYPLVEIVDYPARFLPGSAVSAISEESFRQHIREIWKRRWLTVDAAVQGQPWILESGFSVVDLYIAVVSRWAGVATWRSEALVNVERIAVAVAERDRCRAVWQRHFGAGGTGA